jgi:FkbM family methyltransferase
MKAMLKRWLPGPVRRAMRRVQGLVSDTYAVRSYSQEGEDMILRRIFERRAGGFYVDIGAHHPRRFSNTFFFYKRGWRGINVDATPGSMTAFRRQRPRDVNVEAAVSRDGRELTLKVYDEPALNTLNEGGGGADVQVAEGYQVVAERRLATTRLADILRQHLPPGQAITFMSVDVEGMDLEVLEGNDWGRFRPEVVLVECVGRGITDVAENATARFLQGQGYEPIAKTMYTFFFRDTRKGA